LKARAAALLCRTLGSKVWGVKKKQPRDLNGAHLYTLRTLVRIHKAVFELPAMHLA
jgi:hypothetical protein